VLQGFCKTLYGVPVCMTLKPDKVQQVHTGGEGKDGNIWCQKWPAWQTFPSAFWWQAAM